MHGLLVVYDCGRSRGVAGNAGNVAGVCGRRDSKYSVCLPTHPRLSRKFPVPSLSSTPRASWLGHSYSLKVHGKKPCTFALYCTHVRVKTHEIPSAQCTAKQCTGSARGNGRNCVSVCGLEGQVPGVSVWEPGEMAVFFREGVRGQPGGELWRISCRGRRLLQSVTELESGLG